MSELKIPEAAYAAGSAAYDNATNSNNHWADTYDDDAPLTSAIDAAAPLIVAAELRRLTDHIFSMSRRPMTAHELCADIAQNYLKRADELDPQGLTKE